LDLSSLILGKPDGTQPIQPITASIILYAAAIYIRAFMTVQEDL
jgi:hypothetical protein